VFLSSLTQNVQSATGKFIATAKRAGKFQMNSFLCLHKQLEKTFAQPAISASLKGFFQYMIPHQVAIMVNMWAFQEP